MSGVDAIATEALRLNAICPYFTMFPLDFPLGVLRAHARPGERVLDPFCGRGTTNFAARLLGLGTAGIDSSRVAVAATRAKLASTTPQSIIDATRSILSDGHEPEVPEGDFWRLAYETGVLRDICRLRFALLSGSLPGDVASALSGIVLGALHGPLGRRRHAYFSNQSPRTYGPKPAYAVKFWRSRGLTPPGVDVIGIIAERAHRYYAVAPAGVPGTAIEGDSRNSSTLGSARAEVGKFDWVLTSPPYYGLRTYLPDQWIRNWFLGGPAAVEYTSRGQVSHNGRSGFIADLGTVWTNAAAVCRPGARLVIRFGSIGDRAIESPADLVKESLLSAGWRVDEVRSASNARRGKRQADTFGRRTTPCDEVDVWATLA